jgi:hypothetical protein
MDERVKVWVGRAHRLTLQLVGAACLVAGLALSGPSAARAQADPIAPPATSDDYYVPPGYTQDPPPPAPQAQPYPAPQAQPYPAPQAQPYQPYAQHPQVGRRRLDRLGRGEQVPAGVEVIERRRLVLSFVGVGVFAGSYLAPVVVMFDGPRDSRRALLPVVGVLLENAHNDWLFDGSWGLAVLDAGVQTLGLTLFALGMRRQRYAVYYAQTSRGRTLAFAPGVAPGGLSLRMSF